MGKKNVPCEVYSRVVGYYRPVDAWNPGKQQEFRERRPIDIRRIIKEHPEIDESDLHDIGIGSA